MVDWLIAEYRIHSPSLSSLKFPKMALHMACTVKHRRSGGVASGSMTLNLPSDTGGFVFLGG